MMRALKIAAVVGAIALSGCAGNPPQPGWVTGSDAAYPASRFLTGVGQGTSQEAARDRARGELAKVFSVRITERSEESLSSKRGAAADPELQASASRTLTATTDQVIEGAQIAEVWQEPESHAFHALAVIDRLQTGMALREKIDSLDSATSQWVAQARGSGELLKRVAAARMAVKGQTERAQLQSLLKVVDVSGVGSPPSFDLTSLRIDFADLTGRLRIAPETSADESGALPSQLAAALAQAGFTQSTGTDSDYTLVGSLTFSELAEQGWHWARGELAVALRAPDGTSRGSRRWALKGAGQTPELARRRLVEQADQILKRELFGTVVGFAVEQP